LEQLEFLKNKEDTNFRYDLPQFNEIKMISDKIDYYSYINSSGTENSIKTRTLNIYKRIKEIKEILSNTN
jgi:hypothetical protein